ncbi:3-hydroxyacyl-CoA dehydrogenase NAD-binding domain-containing protein [Rhodococcus opacus]|uniref:3-hydroxyacyl-CoA dehydrogenase NAD-binding domain-containing protein n=1 Tax=Rhodococcus opacus TaxID=37919 RepID=UPI001C49354C|nr:3-hydroxyacyl-CoA dehydrogenase NAD-binding domain-containing protein [Rhodococcus opacus]MBV6759046.1 enoyl-CoA hydratase/isomerase family protein [Rhodococcus opacus]
MTAHYSITNSIAVIRLDNPPVNTLGRSTLTAVAEHLNRALTDHEVTAVVLAGDHGMFSAGGDLTELEATNGTSGRSPLHNTINMVDTAEKPVVAAIDGTCFGGGLELAMGAHYRIATPASRFALPEVNLGFVPGCGGSQRLPRAIELGTAIDMLTTGSTRTAGELAALDGQRLIDKLVAAEDVIAAGIQFAAEVAAVRPLPRIRDLAVTTDPELIGSARARLIKRSRGQKAPLAALELAALASTATVADGLAAEHTVFEELWSSDQSAALRHAFFAEQAARQIPGITRDTPVRPVSTVAVIGAGTMGGGIAMAFLQAGIPVTLLEMKQEALDRGIGVIRRNYQVQADKGKLSTHEFERRMSLLTPSLCYTDISKCDLVIEAVFEDMDVKRSVFTRLDDVMKPGAILATNTSSLDVDAIAAYTQRPGDVLGLHFFSPANVMLLLEIVRGKETTDEVLATAMQLGRRLRKTVVVSGVCDGFIGNRMIGKYSRAAADLLNTGASPAQIDSAIEGFGFAMGPFRMADLAGGDIGWAIRKRVYAENPDAPRDELADALCEMGRFGQKTAGGWYDYEPGRREALPSPAVDALLASFYEKNGIAPRTFDSQEIVQRLVFALVDEGARILQEGIALRASDIDVVYLAGYGFPRHRGGPMFYADTVGLKTVEEVLRSHADAGWEPAPLLVKLAAADDAFTTS